MKLGIIFLGMVMMGGKQCTKQPSNYNHKVLGYKPIYSNDASLKKVVSDTVRAGKNAGKIYAYQNYLLQCEVGEGIHVIDNSNPALKFNVISKPNEAVRQAAKSKGTDDLSESKKIHTGFDIFLSHSNLDRKLVEGIYLELTNKGFSVYVDWIIDPHLDRNNVTKETAEIIRNRMKSSLKLLLAMSTNVSLSKWIPWELGFVDGNTNNCALFPVAPGSTTPAVFHRSEYLLLYPYLKKATIGYSEDLYLTESAHSFVLADSWIRRGINPTFNSINIDSL